MDRISFFALILSVTIYSAPTFSKQTQLNSIFSSKGLTGTLVIASLSADKLYIQNSKRAKQDFSPASTFKILNTLIALEEKAISDENEIIKWNGIKHSYPEWNRNHNLKTAFRASCVWCYQELAKRVGVEKYYKYLESTNYGSIKKQLSETEFWLNGSLTINALEQINFLKSVYRKELPFSPLSYELLQKIMIIEETPEYTLRAKTGWVQQSKPQTGWYIGYIETLRATWFFAMNIEVNKKNDLNYRQSITREAFKILEITE